MAIVTIITPIGAHDALFRAGKLVVSADHLCKTVDLMHQKNKNIYETLKINGI